eukprot:568383-Alexandrium_andersonii.AAC.1
MVAALQPVTVQLASCRATRYYSLVSVRTRSSATLVTRAPRQWCKSTTNPADRAAESTAMLARRSPRRRCSRAAKSSTYVGVGPP